MRVVSCLFLPVSLGPMTTLLVKFPVKRIYKIREKTFWCTRLTSYIALHYIIIYK
jgi:hypothetical protein